jgi:integrase
MLERQLMGEAYQDSGLVFPRGDGAIIHPDGFSGAFWRHAKAAKLPRIRFHDRRHTRATLALAAGVHLKTVSEHAIPAMQETAASLLAALVFEDY